MRLYVPIFYFTGYLLLFMAAVQVFMAVSCMMIGDGAVFAFFMSSLLTGFVGLILKMAFYGSESIKSSERHFGMLFLVWVLLVLPVFAALPLFFIGVDFFTSYMETLSALTTTGASYLLDIETLPRGVYLWQSVLSWLGGFGFYLIVIALFPTLNVGAMSLFSNQLPRGEGENIIDRLRSVATSLVQVYVILTALCFLMLLLNGVSILYALCLAMNTLSTSGFTVGEGQLLLSENLLAQLVIMIFMIIGATNITYFWALLKKSSAYNFSNITELRYFLRVIGVSSVVLSLFFIMELDEESVIMSCFKGVFTAISAASTTGFYNIEYTNISLMSSLFIMVLIFIGGTAGSTAGGIKIMRAVMLSRHVRSELERLAYPNTARHLLYDSQKIEPQEMNAVWALFVSSDLIDLFYYGLL